MSRNVLRASGPVTLASGALEIGLLLLLLLYTDVTAISAQNNFQGLILGGYIYRYTPVATALTVAGVCAVPSVLWAASQLVTSNHRTNPPVVLLSARRTSSSASDLDDV